MKATQQILLIALAVCILPAAPWSAAANLPTPAEFADAGQKFVDDDFSPAIFVFVLLALLLMVFAFVVAAIIYLVIAATIAILIAVGIISSSLAYGMLRKRPSAVLRALVIQMAAVLGAAFGMGMFWAANLLFDLAMTWKHEVFIGATIGLLYGAAIGWLITVTVGRLVRRVADWAMCRRRAAALGKAR